VFAPKPAQPSQTDAFNETNPQPQNQVALSTNLSSMPVASGLLQEKCASNDHTMASGECIECSSEKRLDSRSKLEINDVGDVYEREADQIADQVLAMPAKTQPGQAPLHIQRFSGRLNAQESSAPASVDRVLSSTGRPLDPTVRGDMEQRFGYDFSRVQVHSGTAAEQSARDVNAYAYTVGNHIVFGQGQYAPETAHGRLVLAHELTHVVQQEGNSSEKTGSAPLQRLDLGDVFSVAAGPAAAELVRHAKASDLVEGGAVLAFGPLAALAVHQYKQLIDDLVASVAESPQHVWEFLKDEVWESIKNHWFQIMAVTTGIVIAETAVAALTAAPDPTLLTKVIAVILQIAIIAILGYFAAVEVKGAYEAGGEWLSTAKRANGDPKIITDASRSFVRMVWHIIMAVLVVAGVRARIRGATVPRAGATTGSVISESGAAAGEGGTVTPISSARGFQPRPTSTTFDQPSAFVGPRGEAFKLEPVQQPLPEPVKVPEPSPAPAAATAAATAPSTGPGVQTGPAAAAGVAAAIAADRKRKREPDKCEALWGLPPGMSRGRWHRQRPPIRGQTTVDAAAFRLDPGFDPPAGQDTTEASRDWVRAIGLPKDDAGHVIANRFGGTAIFNSPNGNIFPQDLTHNRGVMVGYDREVAIKHQSGCAVCAHIILDYDSLTPLRPFRAWYMYIYRNPGAAEFSPPVGPVAVPNVPRPRP
jgi:hypothetical protein